MPKFFIPLVYWSSVASRLEFFRHICITGSPIASVNSSALRLGALLSTQSASSIKKVLVILLAYSPVHVVHERPIAEPHVYDRFRASLTKTCQLEKQSDYFRFVRTIRLCFESSSPSFRSTLLCSTSPGLSMVSRHFVDFKRR